jgi:hypothetical protein
LRLKERGIVNSEGRRLFIATKDLGERRGNADAESSGDIRARVEHARAIQQTRGFYNARMPVGDIRKI